MLRSKIRKIVIKNPNNYFLRWYLGTHNGYVTLNWFKGIAGHKRSRTKDQRLVNYFKRRYFVEKIDPTLLANDYECAVAIFVLSIDTEIIAFIMRTITFQPFNHLMNKESCFWSKNNFKVQNLANEIEFSFF